MKKSLLVIALFVSLLFSACGAEVCNVEDCKNEVKENGLCEAHLELKQNEAEQSSADLAEVEEAEEKNDSDYIPYALKELIYYLPDSWTLTESSSTKHTWQENSNPDSGIITIEYKIADVSKALEDIDAYAKLFVDAYKEKNADKLVDFSTLEISNHPAFEIKIHETSKETEYNVTQLAIYEEGGYYFVSTIKPDVGYSDFDMNYGFIKAGLVITPDAQELVEMQNPSAQTSSTNSSSSEDPLGLGIKTYSEGQYKVGTDIEPGIYVILNTKGSSTYFCLSSDANADDIIENGNFSCNTYIDIREGEYLQFRNAVAFLADDLYSAGRTITTSLDGCMLAIGKDLPAGEYKVKADGDTGYYCIFSSSRQDDIVSNDNFSGEKYVTVKEGQYIELSRCHLIQ